MGNREIESWLVQQTGGRLPSAAIGRVLKVVAERPQDCAFATTGAVAALAGVNPGTVVRAAQFLGFAGWPDFVLDYRGRYLATIATSAVVGVEDGDDGGPAASLANDARALAQLLDTIDQDALAAAGRALDEARRITVLATGSFVAAAHQLAYNGQLIGLDIDLEQGAPTAQLNAVRRLGPGDLLVTFNLWKYAAVLDELAAIADEARVPRLVITDRSGGPARGAACAVVVPTASNRLLASTVPTVAVVQAILDTAARARRPEVVAGLDRLDAWWRTLGICGPDLQ